VRLACGMLGVSWSLGCTSEELPDCQLVLITDEATGPYTAEPRPTTLEVMHEDETQTRTLFTTLAVPATDSEMPAFGIGRGQPAFFEVIGSDSSGVPVLRGRTWYLDPASLAGYTLPLFVARTGIFSHPPGSFAQSQGDTPPVDVCGGRFLLSVSGVQNGSIRVDGYDLGLWMAANTWWIQCPGSDCQVKSLAISNARAVMLGSDWARYKDFAAAAAPGDLGPPDGMASYAEVAGGATVHDLDDNAYIVGATRTETPTDRVLRLDTEGQLTAPRLTVPRVGAAATWVPGRGLVVMGGSSEGPAAELMASGSAAFTALPFPADATTGAGIVALDSSTVLRVGGVDASGARAPSVTMSLACPTNCQLEPSGDPVDLNRPTGYLVGEQDSFWVGTDAAGETAARRVNTAGITAVTLRQPRSGGSTLATSTGQIAVLGGHQADGTPALSLDFFQP
jgi:hypothetical protein